MRIHHFRNATMVVETATVVLLIDPMLGPVGTMPPFAFVRFKARRNPTVPLPKSSSLVLDRVTHCLITHRHPDHLDQAAEKFLRERNTPIFCSLMDESALHKRGLNVVQSIDYWQRIDFLEGKIEGIPARHGYGFIAKPMGNVMGYYLELPGEPSLYLSSDTIYTEAVDKVLTDYKPQVSVLAAGSARFDLFQPVLMNLKDILKFIRIAPGTIVANHLEAINHCPTPRQQLHKVVAAQGLSEKTILPEDGDVIDF
jgi:L-ascorbate metabolism protein UlaG (beta-lactamase superfamily)